MELLVEFSLRADLTTTTYNTHMHTHTHACAHTHQKKKSNKCNSGRDMKAKLKSKG